MATTQAPVQGILNIDNVQGNYVLTPLEFKDKNTSAPINLVTTYKKIRLEIKPTYNVNITPFLVFEVGSGLDISGDNNQILSFVLDGEFWKSQIKSWVYDITFVDQMDRAFTLVKGNIKNVLTASSV
jgi:hypothetical protein